MTDIGRRKLGWTTSNRLLEVRTLVGTKSGYSSSADTSARCNGANRVAKIKLRENGILLRSRKRSHDDSGKE